jgi:hypothetical protein
MPLQPMSYHLTRLRMTQTSYSIITLVNSSPQPAYEGVLAIDEEFKKVEASVRSPFNSHEI